MKLIPWLIIWFVVALEITYWAFCWAGELDMCLNWFQGFNYAYVFISFFHALSMSLDTLERTVPEMVGVVLFQANCIMCCLDAGWCQNAELFWSCHGFAFMRQTLTWKVDLWLRKFILKTHCVANHIIFSSVYSWIMFLSDFGWDNLNTKDIDIPHICEDGTIVCACIWLNMPLLEGLVLLVLFWNFA